MEHRYTVDEIIEWGSPYTTEWANEFIGVGKTAREIMDCKAKYPTKIGLLIRMLADKRGILSLHYFLHYLACRTSDDGRAMIFWNTATKAIFKASACPDIPRGRRSLEREEAARIMTNAACVCYKSIDDQMSQLKELVNLIKEPQ